MVHHKLSLLVPQNYENAISPVLMSRKKKILRIYVLFSYKWKCLIYIFDSDMVWRMSLLIIKG